MKQISTRSNKTTKNYGKNIINSKMISGNRNSLSISLNGKHEPRPRKLEPRRDRLAKLSTRSEIKSVIDRIN